MGYNVKNYTEQGAETTVIGGELAIKGAGKVTLRGAEFRPAAGQIDSDASSVATIKEHFNALLQRLQAAGLMERAILAITDAGNNEIQTTTTYTNVSGFDDAWVVDAIITSSQAIPAGAQIEISGLGGDPVALEPGKDTVWLSDLIHAQNDAVPTRSKLNVHTTQAFDFTITGLAEAWETDFSVEIVTSNGPDLANTMQSDKDFGEYTVLTSGTLAGVSLAADPE